MYSFDPTDEQKIIVDASRKTGFEGISQQDERCRRKKRTGSGVDASGLGTGIIAGQHSGKIWRISANTRRSQGFSPPKELAWGDLSATLCLSGSKPDCDSRFAVWNGEAEERSTAAFLRRIVCVRLRRAHGASHGFRSQFSQNNRHEKERELRSVRDQDAMCPLPQNPNGFSSMQTLKENVKGF